MNRKSIVLVLAFMVAIVLEAILATSQASEIVAEKPTWQIGDTWTYRLSENDRIAYFYTLTVVEAGVKFEKKENCYKVEYKSFSADGKVYEQYQSWWYFSPDLVYLGKKLPSGKIEKPFGNNKVEIFRWPLKDKKFWRQEWNEPNFPERVDSIFWVSREKITVPAGEFETFKILHEFEHARGKGRYFNEQWYSPEVKYVVKQCFHSNRSTVVELVKYQVH